MPRQNMIRYLFVWDNLCRKGQALRSELEIMTSLPSLLPGSSFHRERDHVTNTVVHANLQKSFTTTIIFFFIIIIIIITIYFWHDDMLKADPISIKGNFSICTPNTHPKPKLSASKEVGGKRRILKAQKIKLI